MFVSKKKDSRVRNEVPICQNCFHPMVKRQNRFGGYFWGCIMYPRCLYLISIDPLPAFPSNTYNDNPHGWSDEDWHEYADSMGIDEGICWGID